MPESTQPRDESWTHHRARVAQAVRAGNTELAEAARADLRAARAEQKIRELVASAPPLSDETRARLADLLRPAPVAAGDAPAGS